MSFLKLVERKEKQGKQVILPAENCKKIVIYIAPVARTNLLFYRILFTVHLFIVHYNIL